jgi:flagellar protein FliS
MQTAAPGQLVLMLLEGAIRFLDRAEAGFAVEDPAAANEAIHNNIQRSQDVIHELNISLDMSSGGELARTLRDLYQYMDRRLVESNTHKKIEGLVETRRLLTTLRDAWAEMLQSGPTSNSSAPSLALA